MYEPDKSLLSYIITPLSNYYIDKFVKNSQTRTQIKRLSEEETIKEIARVIAGNDITEKFKSAGASFKNAPADEKDYLQLYSFISLLSFDVYMKKQLINTLIETLDEPSKE